MVHTCIKNIDQKFITKQSVYNTKILKSKTIKNLYFFTINMSIHYIQAISTANVNLNIYIYF